MRIVPNSVGSEAHVVKLEEFNPCHVRASGRFGTKGICGSDGGRPGDEDIRGMSQHFTRHGINATQLPETWYPAAYQQSQQAERDPAVRAKADAIRADPGTTRLEKAYAGLVARGELHAQAGDGRDSLSPHVQPDGALTLSRMVFHQRVLKQYIADRQAEQVRETGRELSSGLKRPLAVFFGGCSGAGKSTAAGDLLAKGADALVIDGDEFKRYLKRMDPDLRTAMAPALQRESALLADELTSYAVARHMNVVIDGTMKSLGDAKRGLNDSLLGRLAAAKQAGYRTEVRYVDVTIDQSVQRVLHRYLHETDRGGRGEPVEARFVPPSFVRKGLYHSAYGSQPKASFLSITKRHDLVDAYVAFDGWSGAKLAEHGTLTEHF